MLIDCKTISIMKACELRAAPSTTGLPSGPVRAHGADWSGSSSTPGVNPDDSYETRSVMTPTTDESIQESMEKPRDLGCAHRLKQRNQSLSCRQAKSADETARARATQVVASVLDAMATARELSRP